MARDQWSLRIRTGVRWTDIRLVMAWYIVSQWYNGMVHGQSWYMISTRWYDCMAYTKPRLNTAQSKTRQKKCQSKYGKFNSLHKVFFGYIGAIFYLKLGALAIIQAVHSGQRCSMLLGLSAAGGIQSRADSTEQRWCKQVLGLVP